MKICPENCRKCINKRKPSGITSAKIKCKYKINEIDYTINYDGSWDCKNYKERKI